MPNFTAGTSFTDGVTNDVTAAKLNALIADAVPTSSLSLNSTTGTISQFSSGTGTAASPAIQPTGDANTGIFFPAADTIAFSEGGTESMRIDSSGRVGIGTTSPAYSLEVAVGTSGQQSIANFRTADSTAANNAGIQIFATSSSTAASRNVKLVFDSDGANASGGDYFIITKDGNSGAVSLDQQSNSAMTFNTNATERLRIDSSGNVGIGTTSPSSKLHISGGDDILRLVATDPYLSFYNGSTRTGYIRVSNTGKKFSIVSEDATTPVTINTNDTERLRIDSSGNVIVGNGDTNSSPANGIIRLTNSSGTNVGAGSLVIQAGIGTGTGAGGIIAFNTAPAGSSGSTLNTATERLRITSGGNVLVGTTSDGDHKICVNHSHPTSGGGGITINQTVTGTGRAIQFVYQTNNQVGSITTTASATAYNTSSDYRLKTNLEPISDGIDRLKQLPVYRFNWIADESGNKVDGFVAHEAQAIIPECVTGEKDAVDEDGKPIYQGIDQSKIVPLLTAALKEAIAKIETLESKVAAMEAA